ncbi:uncharacterized protein PAF06_014035 [Gastrophryne carolinensis]
MASNSLRDELNCSICLNVYSNPVMLICGHNFCFSCIKTVLDSQDTSAVYSCPECREEFDERPKLPKNLKLCSIVENCLVPEHLRDNGIYCTYCESDIPASKTCLHCEASLCNNHLKKHSKSVEHVLVYPTASLEDRKCSVHKEVFKYYCFKEAVCVCVSCCLVGEHYGHKVELLSKASEKHKQELQKAQMELSADKGQVENDLETLQNQKKEVQEKSVKIAERITTLMKDIRGQVDFLERSVLTENWIKEEQLMLSISDLIQQRESQKAKLSEKIQHIEELCSMTDPLIVLKPQQESTVVYTEGKFKENVSNVYRYLSESEISLFLHQGIKRFANGLLGLKAKVKFPVPESCEMLLDVNTAHNHIMVSNDKKSASYTSRSQSLPFNPERFKTCQVLSTCSFSSGQHYWEVDVQQADAWIIGVAYESIPRNVTGRNAVIGLNAKSWGLKGPENLKCYHLDLPDLIDDEEIEFEMQSVGIYLNYEAGILTFYDATDDNKKHLMTYHATFSEPLHAAFYMYENKMAFLRDELNCSICLSLYTDPVMLRCGHNFCRECIMQVLDGHNVFTPYTCPECRAEFLERPELLRNLKLCNILERLTPRQQAHPDESKVLCTYCEFDILAVKSCLRCETFLCADHLKKHNRSVEHVLCEPVEFLKDRQCEDHKEPFKYYCSDDSTCMCATCYELGMHRGHLVESLHAASQKKIQNSLRNLKEENGTLEEKVERLKGQKRMAQEKAETLRREIKSFFRKMMKEIKTLQKTVLDEISRQRGHSFYQVNALLKQLEIRKEELSKRIHETEHLLQLSDPVTILKEDRSKGTEKFHGTDVDVYLDETPIQLVLHKCLSSLVDISVKLKENISAPIISNISFDINTACNYIVVSENCRSASYVHIDQGYLEGPQRFTPCQVLSTQSFTSGQYYWEVEISKAKEWIVGVVNGTMERKTLGIESYVGYNNKSWGLEYRNGLFAHHNDVTEEVTPRSSMKLLGVYININAGQLSFYQLCDPIRHLYTFTANFTEHLYAAFHLFPDSCISIR